MVVLMKRTVAILDGDVHQRIELTGMLQSVYRVRGYGEPALALTEMQMEPPDVILLGQRIGEVSGFAFARDLRRNRRFAAIPFICISEKEDSRLRDQLLLVGVKMMLVQPVDQRALMAAIDGMMSAEVERGWKELPKPQRKALEGTISAFNNVARDLAEGRPPAIGPVSEACASLVDVVAKGDLAPLLDKIRNHDNFTYVHSMRFAAFMALFAQTIGLPRDMQIQVATGGLLHDMGMMTIPPWILHKQEVLTAAEWKMVKNHVPTAQKLLQAMGQVGRGIEIIVGQHHERLDGSGYPLGLKGAQLNELARMAGIIDVFCGLTDRRPYKSPLSANAALEMMATTMSGQLDMDLLPRFRDILLATIPAGQEIEEVS